MTLLQNGLHTIFRSHSNIQMMLVPMTTVQCGGSWNSFLFCSALLQNLSLKKERFQKRHVCIRSKLTKLCLLVAFCRRLLAPNTIDRPHISWMGNTWTWPVSRDLMSSLEKSSNVISWTSFSSPNRFRFSSKKRTSRSQEKYENYPKFETFIWNNHLKQSFENS